MIGLLHDDTSGIRNLGKIEKAYIDNPSLMTVLAGGTPDIGNLRETFFYNQMRVRNKVIASRQSDFVIGKYTFEIGGRKKGKQQIEGLDNAYICLLYTSRSARRTTCPMAKRRCNVLEVMTNITARRISAMPKERRSVNTSPNISMPATTAVTGSRAPIMAVGVEPMRWMALAM